MNRTRKLRTRKAIVAAAALSSVVAGGAAGMLAFGGSANAASSDTSVSAPASSTGSSSSAAPADDSARPARAEETPLTGDDLTKATDAALAANPGATVDRAETDGDGGGTYEVHITQADGTQATVKLDDSFAVVATEAGGPGGRGGHGGPGGDGQQAGPHQANGITETPLTGDDLTKATEAAAAAAPGSTVVRAETDADGDSFEVHVTQADGSQATVKLNDDFSLKTVETGGPAGGMGQGQGGPGGRGHGPRGGQAPADAPADASTATTTA